MVFYCNMNSKGIRLDNVLVGLYYRGSYLHIDKRNNDF